MKSVAKSIHLMIYIIVGSNNNKTVELNTCTKLGTNRIKSNLS